MALEHEPPADDALLRGLGPRSPEPDAPWRALARAHRLLRWARAELDPVAVEEGWPALRSVVRCLVLAHLAEATTFGLRPIRLARLLGTTPSTLAYHLDVLEREGLIARGPRPHDRKAVGVRLTEDGQYAVRRLGSALERPAP